MLITGCSNSLLTKFQDKQCVSNCDAPANQRHHFDQPVVQTVQMFVAEMLVGLVVLYKHLSKRLGFGNGKGGGRSGEDGQGRYQALGGSADRDNINTSLNRDTDTGTDLNNGLIISKTSPAQSLPPQQLDGKRVFWLAIPACCDLLATTMMNVGLLLVPVSVFQMVRGAIVLFVGFFSVTFLKRKLGKKQWIGLVTVFGGVFIVGLSAMLSSSSSEKPSSGQTGNNDSHSSSSSASHNKGGLQATIGVALILVAQLFSATQFVVEEFILEKYAMEPLKVVMWEGLFGTSITVFGSLSIAYVFMNSESRHDSMFNLSKGLGQLVEIKALLFSSLLILIMMSTFNVTGMTVTRLISATSRSTIDTSRTVGIWLVSLLIGWETFQILQLAGFLLLVYGTLLFNGIISKDKQEYSSKESALEMSSNLDRSERS